MKELKKKILTAVQDDFIRIEIALKENLNPFLDIVSDTAGHILFSGGKRIRPLLMKLSAKVCGYDKPDAYRFSTMFEYLHTATLVHDDLVDDATIRRGKTVAHALYGSPIAVLVGDFLLSRSLAIAADTGKTEVVRVIAEITENMSQGEIHQLIKKGDLNLTEPEYMEIIRRKTAVLIKGACRAGALIADATYQKVKALEDYGFHVGMAFQIADDLLDYMADTSTLGKTIGADLREGKLTLPVIHALKNADSKDAEWMRHLILQKEFSHDEFVELINKLKTYGGISYAEKTATQFVDQAKHALSVFDTTPALETLIDIADYSLKRKV